MNIIDNIAIKYCSKLEQIQLAALCRTTMLKEYGIENVFRPLIDDIKLLEEFLRWIILVQGNPFSCQSIMFLLTLFVTVTRICRFCMCRKNETLVFDEQAQKNKSVLPYRD